MILDAVIRLVREAEVVREPALLVINDLGMGILEAHVRGGLDVPALVLGHGHI